MANRTGTTAAERKANLDKIDAEVVGVAEIRERNGQPTDLVRTDGRTADDRAFADYIRLAEHAEHLRTDVHMGTDVLSVAVEIRRQADAARETSGRRDLVPEDTIRALAKANTELTTKLGAWMLQRGLLDTDGGS
jgi:hypothetical protein